MGHVLPVLIGVCIGLVLLAVQLWMDRRTRARQRHAAAEADRRAAVEKQCRTAVHEAGHALCAWACFLVDKITVARIEGEKHVKFTYWHPSYKNDVEWCDMVLGLAGFAAELMVYGRSWTGRSKPDLDQARASTAWIIEHKATAPWEVLDVRPLPFAHLFDPPLSPEEQQCLEIAFSKARQLLRDGKDRHAKLVSALLCHRKMTYKDILAVLGDRHWMSAKVMSAVLHGPDAMRAGFVELGSMRSLDAAE